MHTKVGVDRLLRATRHGCRVVTSAQHSQATAGRVPRRTWYSRDRRIWTAGVAKRMPCPKVAMNHVEAVVR